MAIPLVLNTTNQIRLQANARHVERELQSARDESRAFEPSDPRPLQLP